MLSMSLKIKKSFMEFGKIPEKWKRVYELLGITIDDHLRFDQQKSNLCLKAANATCQYFYLYKFELLPNWSNILVLVNPSKNLRKSKNVSWE